MKNAGQKGQHVERRTLGMQRCGALFCHDRLGVRVDWALPIAHCPLPIAHCPCPCPSLRHLPPATHRPSRPRSVIRSIQSGRGRLARCRNPAVRQRFSPKYLCKDGIFCPSSSLLADRLIGREPTYYLGYRRVCPVVDVLAVCTGCAMWEYNKRQSDRENRAGLSVRPSGNFGQLPGHCNETENPRRRIADCF